MWISKYTYTIQCRLLTYSLWKRKDHSPPWTKGRRNNQANNNNNNYETRSWWGSWMNEPIYKQKYHLGMGHKQTGLPQLSFISPIRFLLNIATKISFVEPWHWHWFTIPLITQDWYDILCYIREFERISDQNYFMLLISVIVPVQCSLQGHLAQN